MTGTVSRPPRPRPNDADGADAAPRPDPRLVRRRDLVAAEHRRRRRRVLAVIAAFVVLAGVAVGITRTPLLAVDRITITGVEGAEADRVRAASGLTLGDPMVDVGPAEVRDRIMRLDGVGSAAVRLRWPRGVDIEVAPLRPLMTVTGAGGTVVVAAGGRVLGPVEGAAGADGLPVLALDDDVRDVGGFEAGDRVAGVLADVVPVFEQLGDAPEFRSASLSADGSLRFALPSGGTLLFGPPEDVPSKLLAASTMVRGQVDRDCLATIDVREPSRTTITRTPDCTVGPPTVATPGSAATGTTSTGAGTGTGSTATSTTSTTVAGGTGADR